MTKEIETASDTVRTQLAQFSLENAALTKQVERLTDENTVLKQQVIDTANVIENDLKSDIIVKIQAASHGKYQPNELQPMSLDKLKNIEEVLFKSGAFDSPELFKSIRTGSASFDHSNRLTVGSLYEGGK